MTLPDGAEKLMNRIAAVIKKNKYILIILILGLILIMIPSEKDRDETKNENTVLINDSEFSLKETEEKLENILCKIDGAGKVSVMLSVDGSTERVIAEEISIKSDSENEMTEKSEEREAVILDLGTKEGVVELRYIYPRYTGAVIVAEGAGDPSVRLNIMQAVISATGLGAGSISVIKMATN